MSPTTSNGSAKRSSHAGLNPLFLTTAVRAVTLRAVLGPGVAALDGGAYCAPPPGVPTGVVWNGECVQSGMCSETSTYGSTTERVPVSSPSLFFRRGSCCAEMTCRRIT
jgi:hypothetical protein